MYVHIEFGMERKIWINDDGNDDDRIALMMMMTRVHHVNASHNCVHSHRHCQEINGYYFMDGLIDRECVCMCRLYRINFALQCDRMEC